MRWTPLVASLLAACTAPGVVQERGDDPGPAESCDGLALGVEGDFLGRDGPVAAWRAPCTTAVHAAAGAIDSTLAVRLEDWDGDGPARVTVVGLLGEPLAGPASLRPGETLDVTLVQSGEVLVHVQPEAPTGKGNDYALSVACLDGCDLEYTRYPIVLMHGAGPGDTLGLVDYFYGVKEAVEARGYLVRTPTVDPFSSTEERGEQWADHLDDLLEAGVGRRFNLVGHSQGGIDARYVTSRLGYADQVASVVTISSPHRGSTMADVSAGLVEVTPFGDALVDAAVDGVAALLGLSPQDAMGALATLNTVAMSDFNTRTPDAPGVYYASWAGHTCGILEPVCIAEQDGEVVSPFLGPTYTLLEVTDGDNDGMVPVASASWGDYRGEIPADHLDSVGQLLDGENPAFDHRAFYLSEARRLATRGL